MLHPIAGITKRGDFEYPSRTRGYMRIHEKYLRDDAILALLPLAMRMAGPREALWHALIRKNYGATHFIVGRDHAGPGSNSSGEAFYDPYEAQRLAKQYEIELGISIIPMPEIVYVEEKKTYVPVDELQPEYTVRNISGTQFRTMLRRNEEIPAWFSFPEVIEELKEELEKERTISKPKTSDTTSE